MAPVQRITRYPLLINEVDGLYTRATNAAETLGISLTAEQKQKVFLTKEALTLSLDLCHYVNDMMDAGRILGYPVSYIFKLHLMVKKQN